MKRLYIQGLHFLETSYTGGILFILAGIAIILFARRKYRVVGIVFSVLGALITVLKVFGKL